MNVACIRGENILYPCLSTGTGDRTRERGPPPEADWRGK